MATYATRFVVRGAGAFPVDMLRYDGCYPSDSRAVSAMAGPERDNVAHPAGDPREVELTSVNHNKRWEPTRGRWQSFGWSVVSIGPPKAL
jgi:hypothetical protein